MTLILTKFLFQLIFLFSFFDPRLNRNNMSQYKAYLPLHALRSLDLESILSIALPKSLDKRKYDHHHSRRTLLYYLLSTPEEHRTKLNDLLKENRQTIDWKKAEDDYRSLKNVVEPYKIDKGAKKLSDYWELENKPVRSGPQRSFKYISKFRKEKGFLPRELKIYWNYDEIKSLKESGKFNPETDTDTHAALNEYPVDQRQNDVKIEFIHSPIEEAVFKVPENKQIIVLDFADERMPGGYFLENARTQEEVRSNN